MKLQIASDLHLEFLESPNKNSLLSNSKGNDILALLGDICVCTNNNEFKKYTDLISYASKNYKLVFLVTGNHEYYNESNKNIMTISDVNNRIKKLTKNYDNVKFLNGSIFNISHNHNNFIFYGGTLWTNIPNDRKVNVKKSMNDYKHIYVNKIIDKKKIPRLIEPSDIIKLHKCYTKKLFELINLYKKVKNTHIIVLTHHKPYIQNSENMKDIDYAYMTDLSYLHKKPIIIWCYGHTHKKDETEYNNIKFFSNPKGYPYQNKLMYENNYTIDIDNY